LGLEHQVFIARFRKVLHCTLYDAKGTQVWQLLTMIIKTKQNKGNFDFREG